MEKTMMLSNEGTPSFLERLSQKWMQEAEDSVRSYEELLQKRRQLNTADAAEKAAGSLLTCSLPLCCRCIKNINESL